ncbi:MAG: ABC transporter permease [Kordiimonadaceae bacterium]|jgi:putative ABC transport system permease protein|nr:ABC transporter permease [Kordiimonadaceae bacterium]MDB4218808.1 ABC transporter permease [Emcibacteraceae bacterium]MBT6466369.1 ABC transporter permease [Kordiimonadaceae bacterium]MBT7544117.1 ABC transporter permease [Kordiimonadaceae bacterium]MBT7604312.1 ABC transporter permease [Kordiimonadaceae bacterium]|tara:strand:+ start:7649 stop:8368 length:720 start_codon:yes stop_codon:yes gene_type:complete
MDSIQSIPLENLALAFIPVFVVVFILYRWNSDGREALIGISRMLVQLLIVGYFLAYLFDARNAWIVLTVLAAMLFVSSWISLRTVKLRRKSLYLIALISIFVGGGLVLLLITQGVLGLDPWYEPRYLIPLGGMIFSSSMNSISLAAERIDAEIKRGVDYDKARSIALRAALIPIVNALFGVGIVSLPGMMTGQILSGVSPLIAVRYQVMVMCMLFSASGISAAFFLQLIKSHLIKSKQN